ncbi:MAG TPA: CBS domain-containing protein [Pirellulales bacterium]
MNDKMTAELKGLVRDAMTDQIVAVTAKASAAEAAELLSENGVRHAVIVDSDRHVVGVVSQRDVLKHFIQSMTDQEPTEAEAQEGAPWELGSLIQREPVTVLADVSLASAGMVLTNSKIGCLPVVDENKRLVGSLSIVDILRHIAGKRGPQLEEEFKLFKPAVESKPQIPAFFRRSNGALVMPLSCLDDASSLPSYAMLGYDGQSGRILVKLTSEKEEGARKVVRDNDLFVIPASDFVACFDIKFHGSAFEITRHARTGCFILSPKQTAPRAPAAPPVLAKK